MRILFVSPDTPLTFWSAKYMLEFVSRKALVPPLGLLTVAALLPETWEQRLVDLATAELRDEDVRTNLIPKMPLEQLERGYRRVVETLYSHPWHYDRIWRFLAAWQPRHMVRYPVGREDVWTILRMAWRLGLREPGRRHFWRLVAWAVRHPRDHRVVLKLLGLGYHFRKVFTEMKLRLAQDANSVSRRAAGTQGTKDNGLEVVGRRP